MGISGLLGEFLSFFLTLILSNFRLFSGLYQDIKVALHAGLFFGGRRAASVFSWEDLFVFRWATWKDATRYVDLPEIHVVDGHSVSTYCISFPLLLILSSLVWFLHPRRHSLSPRRFSFLLQHCQISRLSFEKDREGD